MYVTPQWEWKQKTSVAYYHVSYSTTHVILVILNEQEYYEDLSEFSQQKEQRWVKQGASSRGSRSAHSQ